MLLHGAPSFFVLVSILPQNRPLCGFFCGIRREKLFSDGINRPLFRAGRAKIKEKTGGNYKLWYQACC
ncbi:MAG: hypothetical protein J6D21_01460 [Clostridia bacterium]|nr:hypothetical protein [Clostridia bacterium]